MAEAQGQKLAARPGVPAARPLLACTVLLWNQATSPFSWVALNSRWSKHAAWIKKRSPKWVRFAPEWLGVINTSGLIMFTLRTMRLWHKVAVAMSQHKNLVAITTVTLVSLRPALETLCWCNGDNSCEIFNQRKSLGPWFPHPLSQGHTLSHREEKT